MYNLLGKNVRMKKNSFLNTNIVTSTNILILNENNPKNDNLDKNLIQNDANLPEKKIF